ncbi:hypothetical protein GVN16_23305 [Emticicia sp. CRIBPO]|uniref:hypothetical protein n=1 Tax=Emticicia sp. CRIBPO TaxID=2683258 RepID=UPI001412BA03|nr:hypothetical protein [Emticicia sp. CRIBPO]NBA88721.1 hypothetical protein [Emticicia sp. CRIBPO]
MIKNILIPTDFTVESLNLVKSFLRQKKDDFTCNIILLHGTSMSDSITDLLFFSKSRFIDSLSNKAFDEACDIIRNKYDSQVNIIKKDIFTGKTQAAFDHFIVANKIVEAYIPAEYVSSKVNQNGIDIIPFIKKSSLNVREVKWRSAEAVPEKGKLAEVFFNHAVLE